MKIRHSIGIAVGFTFILIIVYFFIIPPRVISVSPFDKATEVNLNSPLIIRFDKPVKRQDIKHFISPRAYGEWKFENSLIKNHLYRTLVFTPAIDFEPNTEYQVRIENITFPLGIGLSNNFSFTFTTKPVSSKKVSKADSLPNNKEQKSQRKVSQKTSPKAKLTLLDIPLDWQDYKLSCEAASLKMALASKGVFVSEDEIMKKIGFDKTPYRDGIWGDPYESFVGDIDGKMCSSGYGVYWQAVAKAANNWRKAKSFSDWKLKDLIKEVASGNPVIVWGTLPVRTLHDCSWHTPEGKYIKAIREDHVRVVVGFIGPCENPSKIILNDPLAGRIYWATSYFLKNWSAFGYSGVVIR